MVFGRSNRPLPQGEDDPNSYTISQQQSLVSLSELNSLLESALRMSGDDAASMLGGSNAHASATATYPPPPPANITDDSESTSSSWRLDTTRKLTAVSMIFKFGKITSSVYDFIICTTHFFEFAFKNIRTFHETDIL